MLSYGATVRAKRLLHHPLSTAIVSNLYKSMNDAGLCSRALTHFHILCLLAIFYVCRGKSWYYDFSLDIIFYGNIRPSESSPSPLGRGECDSGIH